ncbi:hypothetical protein PXO_05733 [Xanthomonas oryzae pv. oryzae PXO99A]|uniref:Uncharacterized protein n=1 Tax=Xanthomonas oryzae pv. oryzae (strain PXO99A) TaxID=360094 RepID=A0A0K0GPA3_XANOP|nr:hypothetical protein PXO_05733 [Xanthomonas oryzae pv. oryzae PXO99A]
MTSTALAAESAMHRHLADLAASDPSHDTSHVFAAPPSAQVVAEPIVSS